MVDTATLGPGAMTPIPARVLDRVQETADTATIVVSAPGARERPAGAGQFHMLYAFGVGEIPISVSAVGPDGETAHTVRAVGPVSAALAGHLPGEMVGVRGPFGTGWPLDDAAGRDLVLVAGGIGLAPLRPVLQQVLADRDRFGSVALLVGARSPEMLLFDAELHAARDHGIQVEVTVDHARTGWRGEVGVVTSLVSRAAVDPSTAHAMVCGPELMIRLTASALTERGLDPDRVSVSLERNMQCAVGTCGHCQLGAAFVCRDGPVFAWPQAASLLAVRGR